MVVQKLWITRKEGSFYKDNRHWNIRERSREGWFLFGIIPLFIRNNASRYYL